MCQKALVGQGGDGRGGDGCGGDGRRGAAGAGGAAGPLPPAAARLEGGQLPGPQQGAADPYLHRQAGEVLFIRGADWVSLAI